MTDCTPYTCQELYLQVANTQHLWTLVQCTPESNWLTALQCYGVVFTPEQYEYLKQRLGE